jgi:hypothetical protein
MLIYYLFIFNKILIINEIGYDNYFKFEVKLFQNFMN